MQVEKNDILKVVKTLNNIEVHGEQNLSCFTHQSRFWTI